MNGTEKEGEREREKKKKEGRVKISFHGLEC
jgi:hypothetical protein